MFDVCIVGAGAMGSAAAYHLSKLDPAGSHCLIGPSEPESRHLDSDRTIYGCHYDEGRITRVISELSQYTELTLTLRSTEDILLLEEESNERIFSEVGTAIFGTACNKLTDYKEGCDSFCTVHGIPYAELDEESVEERWPYIRTKEGDTGIFVQEKSGWISIRNQVRACKDIAVSNGVLYKDDIAITIEREEHFTITLQSGEVITSQKVILSAGAFTNFNNLIERKLHFHLKGHTVLKLEVSEQAASEMSSCPTLAYFYNSKDYLYLLPPILYPNNKYYFKLGICDAQGAKDLETLNEVKAWYCQKDNNVVKQKLLKQFINLFPKVDILSSELDFCVMALTPTGRQYIGFHQDNFLIAAGGNGKSAKMAMELGKMGAKAVLKGQWDYNLNQEDFEIVYK